MSATEPSARWPDWSDREYWAARSAVYNEIVRALQHCYASADAAGVNWTEEGLYSVAASNILGQLKNAGAPPPPPEFGATDRLDLAAVHREWCAVDLEGDPDGA